MRSASPAACAAVEPRLWTGPSPHRPVEPGLLPFAHSDVAGDLSVAETVAATTAAELLGLPLVVRRAPRRSRSLDSRPLAAARTASRKGGSCAPRRTRFATSARHRLATEGNQMCP
jgi:hypothetical protein